MSQRSPSSRIDGCQVGAVMVRSCGFLIIMLLVAGCAASKPILYPNAHLQEVGKEAAERDVDGCREMAIDAGATASQGKSGQVAGSTAVGGAIGSAAGAVGGATAGFLRWLWAPVSPIGSERSGKL